MTEATASSAAPIAATHPPHPLLVAIESAITTFGKTEFARGESPEGSAERLDVDLRPRNALHRLFAELMSSRNELLEALHEICDRDISSSSGYVLDDQIPIEAINKGRATVWKAVQPYLRFGDRSIDHADKAIDRAVLGGVIRVVAIEPGAAA